MLTLVKGDNARTGDTKFVHILFSYMYSFILHSLPGSLFVSLCEPSQTDSVGQGTHEKNRVPLVSSFGTSSAQCACPFYGSPLPLLFVNWLQTSIQDCSKYRSCITEAEESVKQIDSMLLCICLVTGHTWRQKCDQYFISAGSKCQVCGLGLVDLMYLSVLSFVDCHGNQNWPKKKHNH